MHVLQLFRQNFCIYPIARWLTEISSSNKMELTFLPFARFCVYAFFIKDWQGKKEDSKCLLQYFIVLQELWERHNITNWLYEQLMFCNLSFRVSSCKAQLTQELILLYLSLENWISLTFKLSLIFKTHFVFFFRLCSTFSFSVSIF